MILHFARTCTGPNNPEAVKSLAAFEDWLTQHRAQLEQEAAAERPHLESLAKELHQDVD